MAVRQFFPIKTSAVFVGVGDYAEMAVRNLGPATAYYDETTGVSSSVNNGSIAANASATISAGQYFVTTSATTLIVEPVVSVTAPYSAAIVPQTASFNVEAADAGSEYHCSSVGAITVTVRAQATHAIAAQAGYLIVRMGVGGVTVAAAGGVTINSPYGYLTLARQYSAARLLNTGSDVWHLTGDLV